MVEAPLEEAAHTGQNVRDVLISVVVPTWNGRRLLPLPLDSLRRQRHDDFEVIVVDDASTDGTAEWIEATYPEVRLVKLPRNRGFAAAVNAGIRAARGEGIALLNNDAEADDDWLTVLDATAAAHPEAGMVASRVRRYHHRDYLDSAGAYASTYGSAGNLGAFEPDGPAWAQARPVLGPNGAAAFYRRAMLDDVGLLDESLIAYFEDTDLAIRGQLRGWKCVYEPRAICYHVGSASYSPQSGEQAATTPPPVSRRAIFLGARNYPMVAIKYLPLRILMADGWALAAYELNLMWFALVRGQPGAWIGARLSLLAALPHWLRQRRTLRRHRTISEDDLVALFRRPAVADYLRILRVRWRRLFAR